MRSKWTKISLSNPGTILEHCFFRIWFLKIRRFFNLAEKLRKTDGRIFAQRRILSKIYNSRR